MKLTFILMVRDFNYDFIFYFFDTNLITLITVVRNKIRVARKQNKRIQLIKKIPDTEKPPSYGAI
jgi:hypothetical protein